MPSTRDQVHDVIRNVLLRPDLRLTDATTAADVEGWDSLAHISILFSLESAFGIRFADTEMGSIQDVGELVRLVETKTGT